MGKIISNFFISLDGVVEAPGPWHFPYFNDEMGAVVGAGMATNKAFLMGRKLYEEWAGVLADQHRRADRDVLQQHPEVRDLRLAGEPDLEQHHGLPGDVDAVRQIKESIDGDIVMSGSATTVRWLLAEGLLDELRLLVHPIAVGQGQRLFEDTPTHKLELVEQQTLKTGVLNLTYTP